MQRRRSMKKRMVYLIIIATVLANIHYAGSAYADWNPAADDMPAGREFDLAMEDIIRSGKAKGACAAFVQNGTQIMAKGYGYSDAARKLPADGAYSGFRLGSVSKTFVALAALIAEEDGMLDMNRDIMDYLGNMENSPKLSYPVTMQHLLTHTAGFEDMVTGMAVKNISDTEPLSVTVGKYVPKQIYAPGELASYSNYGIALAAYVIECAVGEDFSEYCTKRIFEPLGMKHTTFAHMQDAVMVSHAYLPGGNETLEPYMNLYPEGAAVATAEDMATYIRWLLGEDETILSRENKERLFQCQYKMADELAGIGYVWNRNQRNGSLYYTKKGETVNFYSRIALFPSKQAGLFLSFNTYVPEKEINEIIGKVTDLLLGEKEAPTSQAGATIDIDGCYVNTWSSFTTAEKLLRYLIPGKIIEITGSLSRGFYYEGEKMTHLGNNTYETSIGVVKFYEDSGSTYMATDYSQSYRRIGGWESREVTLVLTLIYFLSTIILMIMGITHFIRKKEMFPAVIISFVQFIALIVLGAFLYRGAVEYCILNYLTEIGIAAGAVAAAAAMGMVISAVYRKSLKGSVLKLGLMVNHIAGIGFCLVMYHLNLLF